MVRAAVLFALMGVSLKTSVGPDPTVFHYPSCERVFTDPVDTPNSYFFLAEKGEKRLLLLGTIHAGLSLRELPCFVPEAVEKADRVATEINSRLFEAFIDLKTYTSLIRFTGPDLSSQLSPDALRIFERVVLEKRYDRSFVERLTPLAATLILTVSSDVPTSGRLDRDVVDLARFHGKTMEDLDSISNINRLFNKWNTIENLEKTLIAYDASAKRGRNSDEAIATLSKIDFAEFEKGFCAAMEQGSSLEDVDLIGRNDQWMVKIRRFLEEPGLSLIVGGSGHLTCDYGLLNRLRQDGFSIVQIKSQDQFYSAFPHFKLNR